MTNILHFSDLHGKLPKIPARLRNPDTLVIVSGDVAGHNMKHFVPMFMGEPSPFGWQRYDFRKINFKAEAEYQNKWFDNSFIPHIMNQGIGLEQIIILRGNHDWADLEARFPNSLNVGSKTIVVKGIKVGLLTGVLPVSGEWQDEVDEFEIRQRILGLDRNIEILVSHSAPYGIRDENYGGQHTGSVELYKAIFGSAFGSEKPYFRKLQVHAFGHSHEGVGGTIREIDGRDVKFSNSATGRAEIPF